MRMNLFEKALRNGEASRFLKGEGDYFLPNPEADGDHSYALHMSGWVASFVDKRRDRFEVFYEKFLSFIKEASPYSENDFHHVIMNISACWHVKKKGLFPDSDILCSEDDAVYKAVREYMNSAKSQPFMEKAEAGFGDYSDYFYRIDASLLGDLFLELNKYCFE